MRYFLLLLVLLAGSAAGCDLFGSPEQEPDVSSHKMVPDSTVYIVSTIEASPDTLHHHTQVYVGRLFDPMNEDYNLLKDPSIEPAEGIWSPMLFTQAIVSALRLNLKVVPEPDASVSITGPANQAGKREVRFTHETGGVYGDMESSLSLIPNADYRLRVKLGGEVYTATTHIPHLARWPTPDTVRIPLELGQYPSGVYFEEGRSDYFSYEYFSDATMTIYQKNSEAEHDRRVAGLLPGEHLQFESKGNYLHMGLMYAVKTNVPRVPAKHRVSWISHDTYPLRDQLWTYHRLSELNEPLAQYFVPETGFFANHERDPWDIDTVLEASENRDTTYLPRRSNFYRLGPEGNPLPKKQSGAVGVFGGYSSLYRSILAIPERSWDPDTLDWKRAN